MNFNQNPPEIYTQNTNMNLQRTNASICDTSGNLLFYTNGLHIANMEFDTMLNGLGLNPGLYTEEVGYLGYTLPQGVLILPKPESSNLYYLFHLHMHWNEDFEPGELPSMVLQLRYTLIDMNGDGGQGEVVEKNVELVVDTLPSGMLTAVRHANGRDWWIFIGERWGSRMYRVLLSPQGVEVMPPQELDFIYNPMWGQAVFTPDGSKYLSYNLIRIDSIGHFFDVFDFDRCEGLLSNHRQHLILDSAYMGGVIVSPNSRYAYVSSMLQVYQFDLQAEDIGATRDTVAIYDGYQSPFSTTFYSGQLAPDGKIYICAPNGVNVLHVIHDPDMPGDLCGFEQHGVSLPTYNAFSMPNFPNYRLGYLEGSPCDTLREPPSAFFTYEAALGSGQYRFEDASQHDIRRWEWTFGDGQVDTIPHPVHQYDSSGQYEVCLRVENPRGSDTYCTTLAVGITHVAAVLRENAYHLYPNPGTGRFTLEYPAEIQGEIVISNYLGQVVYRAAIKERSSEQVLELPNVPAGVYGLGIWANGRLLWQEKLLLLEQR